MGGAQQYSAGMGDPLVCVGSGYDGDPGFNPNTDHSIDVGQAATCEGGYPGIFDMSGNVEEWQDACVEDLGADDLCLARGGSYTGVLPTCDMAIGHKRSQDNALGRGFRCCADLK
jgi:formylglycine-generating enzyme required for sulfatase activity